MVNLPSGIPSKNEVNIRRQLSRVGTEESSSFINKLRRNISFELRGAGFSESDAGSIANSLIEQQIAKAPRRGKEISTPGVREQRTVRENVNSGGISEPIRVVKVEGRNVTIPAGLQPGQTITRRVGNTTVTITAESNRFVIRKRKQGKLISQPDSNIDFSNSTDAEIALGQSLAANDSRRNARVDITQTLPSSQAGLFTPIPPAGITAREEFEFQSLPGEERNESVPNRVRRFIRKRALSAEPDLIGLSAKSQKVIDNETNPLLQGKAKVDQFVIQSELGFRRRVAEKPGTVAAEFGIGAAGGALFKGVNVIGKGTSFGSKVSSKLGGRVPKILKSERVRKSFGPTVLGVAGGVAAIDVASSSNKGQRFGEVTTSFTAIGGGFKAGQAVTGKGIQVVGSNIASKSAEKSVQLSKISLIKGGSKIQARGSGTAVIDSKKVKLNVDLGEGTLKGNRFVQQQFTSVIDSSNKPIGFGVSKSAGFDKGNARFRLTQTSITGTSGKPKKTTTGDITFFEKQGSESVKSKSLLFDIKKNKLPLFSGLGAARTQKIGEISVPGNRAELFKSSGIGVIPRTNIGGAVPRAKSLISKPLIGKKAQTSLAKFARSGVKKAPEILNIPRTSFVGIKSNVKNVVGQIAKQRAEFKIKSLTKGTSKTSLFIQSKSLLNSRLGLKNRAILAPKLSSVPKITTVPDTSLRLGILTRTTTRLTPITRSTTRLTPTVVPPIVPIIPAVTTTSGRGSGTGVPPFIPPIGDGGEGGRSRRKGKGRKTKLTPDFRSSSLKIFGKAPKGKLTGFELRPLVKRGKK